MESKNIEDNVFKLDPAKLIEAYTKLPPIFESLKDPQFKSTIERLVSNYANFIDDIDILSNLIVSREITSLDLDLLKQNYYVLNILMGEDIYLLDNLIHFLTPANRLSKKGLLAA